MWNYTRKGIEFHEQSGVVLKRSGELAAKATTTVNTIIINSSTSFVIKGYWGKLKKNGETIQIYDINRQIDPTIAMTELNISTVLTNQRGSSRDMVTVW